LARALAVHPRFVLLDEPFSGVDLATKTHLLSEISRLANEQCFQIILVSHDLWEAIELCEAAVVLERGLVRGTGMIRELMASDPYEPFASYRQLQIRLSGNTGYEQKS
jgi:ABC-type molybdate transport system ATPase subunit